MTDSETKSAIATKNESPSLSEHVAGRGHMYPQDWMVVGYSLLMVIVLLAIGRPLSEYADEILVYTGMAGLALLIVHMIDGRRNRLVAFLRLCYPALMFGAFYSTTGGTMFLVFDGFLDWQLTTFEQMVFGVNPTLYIDQHLLNVWLNEIIIFCYDCYYIMIPAFVLGTFLRRDYAILRIGLAAICLTFFLSYPLFFLYPLEGPRWHFAAEYINSVDGPMFVAFVHEVMRTAAVRGGCMPSTHTGVALAIMLTCFRYYRPVGWIMLPIVIGLSAGTFWGRFHYITDVVVGAAIALVATLIVWKYYERWGDKAPAADRTTTIRVPHAA